MSTASDDNWSLIGNEIFGYGYDEDTIETLRQKLIEDYIYLVKNPDWLNRQEKDYVDQINKRFGHE